MASAFGHAAAAAAIACWSGPRPSGRVRAACIACAIAPDADAIGFWAGVPYDSMLGHRGLTHSLAFAALLAALAAAALGRGGPAPRAPWLPLFLAAASHGLIDACTNGGLGVALLAPFSAARSFFPWTPIEVSPISVTGFFSARGLAVLASEARWIGIPAAALAAAGLAVHRRPRAA